MNTGHIWTKEEEKILWEEYIKGKFPNKRAFAKFLSPLYGVSSDAIRAKITELESRTENEDWETGTFEQGDDFINIVCASPRMMTEKDVLEQFKVDTNTWEVEKFKVKTSEGYRKDRKVTWKVEDGVTVHGDVQDTGKMLVVPLYHVEVRLRRKTDEVHARSAVEDIKADALNYSPIYKKLTYPKSKDGLLLEIGMPDIHFGRLTWHEESGEDYDIKIAESVVNSVLEELLEQAKNYKIEKILLPIGNDFFNVNSMSNTTVKGTPQQEDTRWQKTFREGRQLAVGMIERCSQIAKVDVLIIKGNHDAEKIFYMGDALFCWFHKNPNVSIDNNSKSRKYYLYGNNLIGFTHGSEEPIDRLPMLMPTEVPELWAKSVYREFHTGDKHRKFDTRENGGVVIRILRSLAAADAWTYDKGFIGALRAAEAFLWHKERGLKAQFTAQP